MSTIETLSQYLADPPARFRSVPFWSWNDQLDDGEITRQVADMKDHGIGGFFMHAREGLETPYLGDAWFSCVKTAVAAAKAAGTSAWIYDEDRFPSGHAAGAVTEGTGELLAAKALVMEIADGAGCCGSGIEAMFRVTIDNGKLVSMRRIRDAQETTLSPGESILVFRMQATTQSGWYNGNRAADLLDPQAVAAFIKVTHERYRDAVGMEFGHTVQGVFTDEPAIGAAIPGKVPRIPWTRGFAEYFRAKRGYELLDMLPYLFFDGASSTKIRHDFWHTVTQRYSESFSGQVGEWCRSHNLHFTGHFLAENNLAEAVRTSGAVMPQYVHQTIPGIDILGLKTDEWSTLRQCASVANQFGKERVLAEVYGCTGWELTLEGQKRMIDWLLVNGVNFVCQHLALYSTRGCRKRDFPPSINYQAPAWEHQQSVEEYSARLCAILSQGQVKRDVLLLHPGTSAWALTGAVDPANRHRGEGSVVNDMGAGFNTLVRAILSRHHDLDIGDELLMAGHGCADGNRIGIGGARYGVVILPPVRTILGSTAGLLRTFLENGGTVIAMEPLPAMIDAEASDAVGPLFSHRNMRVVPDTARLLRELETALPRTVSISDGIGNELSNVFCMLRELDDAFVLFVVNTDPDRGVDACITVAGMGTGTIESWDVMSGEQADMRTVAAGDSKRFTISLGAGDSRLFVMRKGSAATAAMQQARPHPRQRHPLIMQSMMPFTRNAPNVLVLDRCEIRIAGGEWSPEMEVWQAQRSVRKELGMHDISRWGVDPRWMWVERPHASDGTQVECRFRCEVKQVPQNACRIAIETAEEFTLTLNNKPVDCKVDGWYLDRSIGTVELPALREGDNELVLGCAYRDRTELENCFLLGDFAVDALRCVVAEPSVLQCGDWCLQGYPYYCGSMTYHCGFQYNGASSAQPGERVMLELGDRCAATVAVIVNGRPGVRIPWSAANSVDITDMLVHGHNSVDIEVFGSPRNVFGPFHVGRHVDWVDPGLFIVEGEGCTSDYRVQPYGLMTPVRFSTGH